jgi:hypothetical protein
MNGYSDHQDSSAARHSFVLRIWREKGNAGWRGWVHHIRSGESTASQDLNELLAFVECRTGRLSGFGDQRLK